MREKCRLCLGTISARKGCSISDDKISPILCKVFYFPLSRTDPNLPTKVCPRCVTTVRDFSEFSEEVRNNQEILLQACVKREDNDPDDADHQEDPSEPDNVSEHHPLIEDVEVTLDDGEDSLSSEDVQDTVAKLNLPAETEKQKHTERTDGRDEATEPNPGPVSEQRELHENDRIIREFFTMRCELCPAKTEQQFDRFFALQLHYRKQHQCRGFLRCCGKQLYRRFRVMEHIASHRGTIRCELCDRTFKSKRYLLHHVAEQHVDAQQSKSFGCEHCDKTFHTKRQRDAHRIAHEITVCKLCGKTVNSRYIKKHIAQVHDAPTPAYMCDLCGKNFSTSMVLDRHIKQHRGIETVELVQCVHCGKRLRGKYNMQRHMQRMHLEVDRVHRCDVCGHDSPNSIALEHHKKRVHSGDQFACDQCGKRFKRKIYLTEHVAALHTRMPLYKCEFCEATFNSKANYYSHRKSRHTEEWETLREEKERKEAKGLADGV